MDSSTVRRVQISPNTCAVSFSSPRTGYVLLANPYKQPEVVALVAGVIFGFKGGFS